MYACMLSIEYVLTICFIRFMVVIHHPLCVEACETSLITRSSIHIIKVSATRVKSQKILHVRPTRFFTRLTASP